MWQKLTSVLGMPFRQNLGFFLLLFFLVSSVNIISRTFYVGLTSGLLWGMYGFLQSYILCLILPLLHHRTNVAYKILLLLLGAVNFFVDLLLSFITDSGFESFVGLILGTNINESLEFFRHYITFYMLLCFVASIVFLGLVYLILRRYKGDKFVVRIGIGLIVVSVAGVTFSRQHHFGNIFLGKIVTFTNEYQLNNHNLKEYYSSPTLIVQPDKPANVVVVIGESLSKDFCSLYGYEKNTNPQLGFFADSLLTVYEHVTSGGTVTVENIQYILSSFHSRMKTDEWYECQTLPEVLSLSGYKTYWISNQSEVGFFDNIPTKYAQLCDTAIFIGNKKSVMNINTYDELVLSPFKDVLADQSKHKVIFIHLLGSHPEFDKRFPPDRCKYVLSDYLNYPSAQRADRAAYDNSILYNDSVVSAIFHLMDDKEAICFYFPDHGLDMYQTKVDYSGHARKGDRVSENVAKRIPFMVYTTPLFLQAFPNRARKIYESVGHVFVTEYFMYTLMDIVGIQFADNQDVEKYSLFSTR